MIEAHRARHGLPPAGIAELKESWVTTGDGAFPVDPFDGKSYGYDVLGDDYVVWSSGLDPTNADDDIELRSSGGAGE